MARNARMWALCDGPPEKGLAVPLPQAGPRRGFTLVECLTVLAIVAALSAVVLGAGRQVGETGRVARTRAELVTLAAALETYRRQHGDYPRTDRAEEMLQALIGRRGPTGAAIDGACLLELARFRTAGGADPFTDSRAQLVDAWEEPYCYGYRASASWASRRYVLGSAGPDGVPPALLPDGGINRGAAGGGDNLFADP